jgi:metallo-beta-lactamase family protein
VKISFLGAAGTVTGSRYLIEHEGHLVLIDCGLFQGYKNLRLMNWEAPPFDPRKLTAVVLTHAHLDHSGALPRLVKQGFAGRIHASPATRELCEIMLPDSARLQEEDAEHHNRHGSSRHKPALPLYDENDARAALEHFSPLKLATPLEMIPGVEVRLQSAGHILGAASVELRCGGRTIVFSGDLGRPDDVLMLPPEPLPSCDEVVLESTYGDRVHAPLDGGKPLGEVIRRTVARGGTVLIPAFAVGRAQTLLLLLSRLQAAGAIPQVPVYLNSPMAIDMTDIYLRHHTEHRLTAEECAAMNAMARMVRSTEASRALNASREPAVIVSASGMATGGRVLHHLKSLAPDARNAIVFAGYQAGGTRGARLVAGERRIRIFGEDVEVNAEVVALQGMSAHADSVQLLAWLKTGPRVPQRVFLTHGEPGPADQLRQKVESALGCSVRVPHLGEVAEFSGSGTVP